MTKLATIPHGLSAPILSGLSASLFANEPTVRRTLQKWRPYICPFEDILPLVPEGSTVLDIGCGSGLLLGLLASAGRLGKCVGVDVSVPALDAARRMAEGISARGTNADLCFMEAAAPDQWQHDRFDVVTMIDVAHHIPPQEQEHSLREACRRVAPGGRFIYKDMARRPRWQAAANRLHDLVLARQWINYLPIEEVERIAAGEGLTLELRSDTSRLWYAHELRLFTKPPVAA